MFSSVCLFQNSLNNTGRKKHDVRMYRIGP